MTAIENLIAMAISGNTDCDALEIAAEMAQEELGGLMLAGGNPSQVCPNLLSHEQAKLCYFIQQTPNDRKAIMAESLTDQVTSGSLIYTYRWALTA